MWVIAAFLAGVFFGAILTGLLLLWYTIPHLERWFVFRPSKHILRTPKEYGIDYEQCFIETCDGARLSAWHMRPENPVASVVYFHGNGGNLGILNELFVLFYSNRLEVFAVDYRGYGWSTGSPSEEGLYLDAAATVEYFNSNFRNGSIPLVYWGRSLGSCAAAFASKTVPPNGLILETAFASKSSLLEDFPRLRPFQLFSRYRLDTVTPLAEHTFPVLVMHGDKDKTIPIRQGQVLYNRLSGPKQFWTVQGADHINIHMIDSDRYMSKVISFVQSVRPVVIH